MNTHGELALSKVIQFILVLLVLALAVYTVLRLLRLNDLFLSFFH